MDEELFNKVVDEIYSQYKADHSMQFSRHIHPMFYNGTFSENNEYVPEEPEPLLSKEEFIEKLKNDEDFKWFFAFEVLYLYLAKQK